MLSADSPAQVANNAFLKLCRLDVAAETEKWARTRTCIETHHPFPLTPLLAPKFSLDGRVAVITIDTGFQGIYCISSFKVYWGQLTNILSASCHRYKVGRNAQEK